MKKIAILVLAALFLSPSLVLACSDFIIKAKDKTVVNGRSMEFPIDLKSHAVVVPRGTNFTSIAPNNIKGLSWTTKYGFIGLDGFNLKNVFMDGFNEKGLSFSGLMYTGAKYQEPIPGKSVALSDFCSWALGSFATVDEVKQALETIVVCDSSLKKAKGLGMHFALHDNSGKNIVIEFINGQMKIYDNPLGVMTNRPEFDWQLTNLRNYVNLESQDKNPKTVNGVKIEPTGVGSGMLGLPGDWTPASRFVRLALCIDAALPAKNFVEAVNLAEHILNTVDIPRGVIKESTPVPFIKMYGYAQWAIIKDLTNKVLYYKTYENTAWKSIDLKKFDLNPGSAQKSISIDSKEFQVIDVSPDLK